MNLLWYKSISHVLLDVSCTLASKETQLNMKSPPRVFFFCFQSFLSAKIGVEAFLFPLRACRLRDENERALTITLS